jgi:hypothetical protein
MTHEKIDEDKTGYANHKYVCTCGFVAGSDGSLVIHIANNNNQLKFRERFKDRKPPVDSPDSDFIPACTD